VGDQGLPSDTLLMAESAVSLHRLNTNPKGMIELVEAAVMCEFFLL
jgi:hypothetical protein